jgi:hypothetical protein
MLNAVRSEHASTAGLDPARAESLEERAALHTRLRESFEAEARRYEQRGHAISWLRLGSFLAAAVCIATAISKHSWSMAGAGALSVIAFFAAVVQHGRTLAAQDRALVRRDIHDRHLARLGGGWTRFTHKGETLLPRDHAYAWDIDLIGQGSLFQRIDVTHTREGERALAEWLGSAAERDVARARQSAVLELRDQVEFRQELEATASPHLGEKLDGSKVEAVGKLEPWLLKRPALIWISRALPLLTVGLWIAGEFFGSVPDGVWIGPALLQAALLAGLGRTVHRSLDIVGARAPLLEAYKEMLLLLERTPLQSAPLRALQAQVAIGDVRPSAHLKRLAFWVGLSELRYNLFHFVINTALLWDLHVLWGIERFVRDVGSLSGTWFSALGELEALASLATLAHGDPDATMPELLDEQGALSAEAISHPLLAAASRVPNDVELKGPGSALVVTGSNMAGKSTLLRAVGQNIALALAGGPVIAHSMRVPRVRLRASMRAEDSLEAGSSYFHAELSKLKRVIAAAEASPPVFFLLDELLRGTNARARHVGAKAVLLHLLSRRGTGLCATHDTELAGLAESSPQIANVHFTDVVIEGEMGFDYKLRPGIVRTSNALRLLALAGVDVPAGEREALEGRSLRAREQERSE